MLLIKQCNFIFLWNNADPDKYFYSEYGISFDKRETLLLRNGGFGRNIIKSVADMNSSVHLDNKKKTS